MSPNTSEISTTIKQPTKNAVYSYNNLIFNNILIKYFIYDGLNMSELSMEF